ncbi:FAD/NAD(P)-binding protein [Actinomycetospora aeridis]|uniref:FAD/NAD(P)-binding protein n=1 Tax=Actinomycetospora aeridis TaxID=3129231 RepID=A0ABU8NBT8_9PSEU
MSSTEDTPSVVVVGNGAAGTLVVIELLRVARGTRRPLRVTWVGDGAPARGVAYATGRPWHRLNVPASSLTLAGADRTFPDWLAARDSSALTDPDDPRDDRDAEFAPRWAFGSYLADTLLDVRAATDRSLVDLEVVPGRAVGATMRPRGVDVDLADGRAVHGDRVVLATGPFGVERPPGATDDALAHPGMVVDPWRDGALDASGDQRVVLLGTGLTMVDAALSIARADRRVRLLAVSRSGFAPRAHSRTPGSVVDPVVTPDDDLDLDEIVDAVHLRIAAAPDRWRDVVDGLRPVIPGLWRSLSLDERARFLTEHARRWEIHRHRMAPAVADELRHLTVAGRLQIRSATVHEIDAVGARLVVRLREPTKGVDDLVEVDRVLPCVGAQEDVTAVSDPLVRSLLREGHARPHPLGLGFDTDPDGALTGAERRLFTLGATRRGDLYETTAIPEIRDQAESLARLLVPEPARAERSM